MEIQIKKDANGFPLDRYSPINWDLHAIMQLCAGHRLTVETKYLFEDQYNCAPVSIEIVNQWIGEYHDQLGDYMFNLRKDTDLAHAVKSLTTTGLRIMDRDVEYVIDDERIGKQRCNWCGEISTEDTNPVCPKCKRSYYLKSFKNAYFVKYPNGFKKEGRK